METKWKQKNPALTTIRDVVMANTGLSDEELINDTNLYEIKDIDQVVNVLNDAKLKDIFVTVVGDYDTDGVTSSSEWEYILKEMGIRYRIRLPKRHSEGYGLNVNIIDEIDDGILITVDNGIAAIDAIKKAKDKGLYVIIVDHHKPVIDTVAKEVILPEADIIIDPHAIKGQADFNDYCGAGLTYKIAEKLFDEKSSVMKKITSFAAIGTVGDVVPLVKDNRNIVKKGLSTLLDFRGRTTGLAMLMKQFWISERITAEDIAFGLSPAINACGRLGDPIAPMEAEQSRKLLCFNGSLSVAEQMAMEIAGRSDDIKFVSVNEERKRQVRRADRKAESIIEEYAMWGDAPIVINIEGVNEGLIGIVAGHLTEKHGVPAIVFTPSSKDPNILKGSGRSTDDVDLKALLDTCASDIEKYGGHPGAAGLSIKKEKLDEFRMHLQENIGEHDFVVPEFTYDLEIKEGDIESLIPELDKYGPYGQGNPQPVFLIRNYHLCPKDSSLFKLSGAEKEHIRFFGATSFANAFWQHEKYLELGQPKTMNIIGTLDVSSFNGNTSYGLKVIDMEAVPEVVKKRTPLAELINQKTSQKNQSKGIV